MRTVKKQPDYPTIERKRINISSKRQITIPAKFFNELNLDKELDCLYANGMMILIPVKHQDSSFAEEILADLIDQGYSGNELLSEFKKINHLVRPAVEKLIEEADKIAEAALSYYSDPTDEIFGDDPTVD